MTPAKISALRDHLIFELGFAAGQLSRASEMVELEEVDPGGSRILVREQAENLQRKIKAAMAAL